MQIVLQTLRRCLSVYKLWWTPLSHCLSFELDDSQHAQDSTGNISKSCQVSRLPALLGGKKKVLFFACTKNKTCFFLNFDLTQNPGHGFASSSSSLCRSGGMFSDSRMVSIIFSEDAVNLSSIQYIFGRSLPCVQQHQAMCCFNRNRFLASKSLYTILIRSAIFAYWQYESTEIWCKVIKVACSVYMVRAHAVIITGWTTYIFINLNWWDIIVTCFFPGTTHNTSLICSWSNQSLKHHQYFFSFLYATQTRDLNRGTACKSMLMLQKTCWEWLKPAKTNATLVGKHLVDLLETIFFRAPVLLMAVMSSKFYPGLFLARKEWHVRVVVHKW